MRVLGYRDFPYLPPFTGRKERPTHKRFWEKSVYYWWWEYLKRNGQYGPDHPLFSDFGEIHTHFVHWWSEKGEYLFANAEKRYEFKRVTEPLGESVFSDDSVMIVQVPLDEPVTSLKKRFGSLLDAMTQVELEQGERAARSSTARYPVVGQPNVDALKKTLAVYDLWLIRKPEGKALWEIWLELNPYLQADLDRKPENAPDIKMSWAAGVSRYIKKAKAMINNAAAGRFPDIN